MRTHTQLHALAIHGDLDTPFKKEFILKASNAFNWEVQQVGRHHWRSWVAAVAAAEPTRACCAVPLPSSLLCTPSNTLAGSPGRPSQAHSLRRPRPSSRCHACLRCCQAHDYKRRQLWSTGKQDGSVVPGRLQKGHAAAARLAAPAELPCRELLLVSPQGPAAAAGASGGAAEPCGAAAGPRVQLDLGGWAPSPLNFLGRVGCPRPLLCCSRPGLGRSVRTTTRWVQGLAVLLTGNACLWHCSWEAGTKGSRPQAIVATLSITGW